MAKIKDLANLKFSVYYHDMIIKEVSKLYNVDDKVVFLGSRKKNIIYAKRMYIYILRQIFGLSLQEIGDITNLHHASILHHTRTFDFFYGTYIDDNKGYQRIKRMILDISVDERINEVKKTIRIANLELTKLINIKKEKDDKQRKDLSTK